MRARGTPSPRPSSSSLALRRYLVLKHGGAQQASLSLDSHELGHLVGKLDAAPGHPIGAQLLGHDHILARPRSLGLEERPSEPGLPNDREESPHPKLGVIGDGNRPRRLSVVPLHDDVAPAPTHLDKAVFGEDATDVTSREGSEPTQPSRRAV